MCSDVSVTLSLFDAQAVSFHQKLGGMRSDPKVIVATSINPKMVGGILLLISYVAYINMCNSFFSYFSYYV